MRLPAFCLIAACLPGTAAVPAPGAIPDLREIVATARSVDAEYSSDALLTLVELGAVSTPSSQRMLLETAWEVSAGAQERAALRMVAPGAALTSGLSAVSRKGMDSVSLRVRVVRCFLKFDPLRARDLYERIELPEPPAPTCEERFAPDNKLYFRAMGEVLDSISVQNERDDFLVRHSARLLDIEEVRAFLDMISSRRTKIGAAALSSIASIVSNRLTSIAPNRLGYSSDAQSTIRALGRFAIALPSDRREETLRAARSWLTSSANIGFCQDLKQAARLAEIFNATLAPLVERGHDLRIGTAVTERAPRPPGESYSSEKQRYARMEYLLGSDSATGPVANQRWDKEMQAYVAALVQWKRKNEPVEQYYLEKAGLLGEALNLQRAELRPGTDEATNRLPRPDTARVLVEFLDGDLANEVYRTRRALWFAPVLEALGSSGHDSALDDLLIHARSPVLRLYGMIGKILAEAGLVYH